MSKPSLNPSLKKFWKTKADTKVLKGGRASSKTWDAAGFAVFLSNSYTVKFLCMRQFQSKISESVYAILVVQIERFGLKDRFDIQKSVIRNKITGSEFHFYGIHRNISEIKGFEGADIGWIEEAEGLTQEQWSVIEPTLRKEGAEAWILYNPRLESDFVERNFKHDPANGVIVRQINYDENPFLSQTMLRKIKRLKDSDLEEYEHIYLGIPKSDDDDCVIKRSWVMAAIDAHINLDIDVSGEDVIGFDVADSGQDLCSTSHKKGIVSLWGESWKGQEDELLRSCTRVYNKALEVRARIKYDSIGVGAGAGSKFKELNETREEETEGKFTPILYNKYVAGGAVVNPDDFYVEGEDELSSITNKDFFSDVKAQDWWLVADRFRNTYNAINNNEKFEDEELLSISSDYPNLSNLIDELCTPYRKFDRAGKVKVESKDDLKKRGIKSPNDADSFIMSHSEDAQADIGFFDVVNY